jgi:hypothetical protein
MLHGLTVLAGLVSVCNNVQDAPDFILFSRVMNDWGNVAKTLWKLLSLEIQKSFASGELSVIDKRMPYRKN